MAASPEQASFRYLGMDTSVLTDKGALPVQHVTVGDWVMADDGAWAQVTHARRMLHKGPLVHVSLVGGGSLRTSPSMPLGVGPEMFHEAYRLRAGDMLLTPLVRLPGPQDRKKSSLCLAWMNTELSSSGQRTYLRTPWGCFLAEPPARPPHSPREAVPTLSGRYRITPAGLVRLASPPMRAKTTMAEALGRHRQSLWQQTFPPSPDTFHRLNGPPASIGVMLCEQAVACCRQGDRIEFGTASPRAFVTSDIRALPRRVESCAQVSHVGWVFALTLAGADAFVAGAGLVMHFPHGPPCVHQADTREV